MIQITYISTETRPMSPQDLEDILHKSRKNNLEFSITGMLLYGNRTFIQILEGEEESINKILKKIKKDSRHTGFRLISKKQVKERQYSDWNMGFKNLSNETFENINGIGNFSKDDLNTQYLSGHEQIVDILMEHFRQERSNKLKHEELSLEEEDKLILILHHTIRTAVKALAVLMVFVIIWGVLDALNTVFMQLISPGLQSFALNHIVSTFGSFLAVLIAIEIFINITLYIRKDVLHIKLVVATALMAISRKVIIFDFRKLTPDFIYGTALVILSLGITYWLIERNSKSQTDDYSQGS